MGDSLGDVAVIAGVPGDGAPGGTPVPPTTTTTAPVTPPTTVLESEVQTTGTRTPTPVTTVVPRSETPTALTPSPRISLPFTGVEAALLLWTALALIALGTALAASPTIRHRLRGLT